MLLQIDFRLLDRVFNRPATDPELVGPPASLQRIPGAPVLGESDVARRRREASASTTELRQAIGAARGSIGPDVRNRAERAIDATELGQLLRANVLGGFSPVAAADPRGLQLPERFAQGVEGTARGLAEIISTELPNTGAAESARDFLASAAEDPLAPSSHPFAVAAEGLGSMAAPLLAAGVATAFGAPSIVIFGATAAAAFPGAFGEAAGSLRDGGSSEEEIAAVAPILALGNSVLEAVVPKVLGQRAVAGPATRKATQRFAATLIRINSEGIQEGTTESAQGLVNIMADAFLNDNPAMTKENALQLARDFYGGYVTAIVASGGIDAVRAAGPDAGAQLEGAIAAQDAAGTPIPAPRVVVHQDFTGFEEAATQLEADGFTKVPLESSAVEGLSPEEADAVGQRFVKGDEEVLVSRNTRPGEGDFRATFFDSSEVVPSRASSAHNSAPLESRGSTLTTSGLPPAVKPRFIFSPFKDRETIIPREEITAAEWQAFRDENIEVLDQPDHFVGTWTPDPNDPANAEIAGQTFIDVSIGVADASDALRLAKDADQEAVFDSETGEALSIADLEALVESLPPAP